MPYQSAKNFSRRVLALDVTCLSLMSKAFTKENDAGLDFDGDDLDASVEETSEDSGHTNYITSKGFKALQEEYQTLFSVERPKLVETIAWAASNGDRSENGDYIYGKRRLREIDRRLRFLGRRMASAVVVPMETQKSDQIHFGARVTVEDQDGHKFLYHIVGEDEINLEERKISWVSPVAKALLGKRVGETTVVQRPNGETELVVIKFEYKE